MPSYDPVRHRRDCDRALAPSASTPTCPSPISLTGADVARAFAAADVHFWHQPPGRLHPTRGLVGVAVARRSQRESLPGRRLPQRHLVARAVPPARRQQQRHLLPRPRQDACRGVAAPGLPGRSPLEQQVPSSWLWRGRHVHLVDGLVVSMPDPPENQTSLPQPPGQQPGWGFPLLRLVLIVVAGHRLCAGAGLWPLARQRDRRDSAVPHLAGDHAGRDIAVLDRYYARTSWWRSAAVQGGHGSAVHQRRSCDFSRGQRLGRDDHVVVWRRPERPDWMRVEAYEAMPKTLTVREVRVRVPSPVSGWRPWWS